MAGIRHHNNSGSTSIPWETLQDENLSFLARGVLGDALSRPPGWNFSIERMARACNAKVKGAGREAVASACRELEDAGYRRVVDERGPDGRLRRFADFAFRPVEEWKAEAAAQRARRTTKTGDRTAASRSSDTPPEDSAGETPGGTERRDAAAREPRAVRETRPEEDTHTGPAAAPAPPDPWAAADGVCEPSEDKTAGTRASVSWDVTDEHITAGAKIIERTTHPKALALLLSGERDRLDCKAGALLARGWDTGAVERALAGRTNASTFAPVRILEPVLDDMAGQTPRGRGTAAPRSGPKVEKLRAQALTIAAKFEETDGAVGVQHGLWRLTTWLQKADAAALAAWLADPVPEAPAPRT